MFTQYVCKNMSIETKLIKRSAIRTRKRHEMLLEFKKKVFCMRHLKEINKSIYN